LNSPTLLTPNVDPAQQWLKQIALFLGLIFGTIVLAFCFFASSLCITIVLAAFLAILIDPLVVRVAKIGLGRVLASGLVVLCSMLLAGALTYVLYSRVSAFADEFPSYAFRIQHAVAPFISKLDRIQENAQSITPLLQGAKQVMQSVVRPEAPGTWMPHVGSSSLGAAT
jgi:predicted PurR-regulated permease PerM